MSFLASIASVAFASNLNCSLMWSTIAAPLLAAGSVLSVAIQEPLLVSGDPPHLPPFPFPCPEPVTHTVYDLIYNNARYANATPIGCE